MRQVSLHEHMVDLRFKELEWNKKKKEMKKPEQFSKWQEDYFLHLFSWLNARDSISHQQGLSGGLKDLSINQS